MQAFITVYKVEFGTEHSFTRASEINHSLIPQQEKTNTRPTDTIVHPTEGLCELNLPLHFYPPFIDSQSWMRDVESGTSEKNVNTPLASALDLPFPFSDTWMGALVQHCNVRQNYQPIETVKAQGIYRPPNANHVRNAPFDT